MWIFSFKKLFNKCQTFSKLILDKNLIKWLYRIQKKIFTLKIFKATTPTPALTKKVDSDSDSPALYIAKAKQPKLATI